MTSVTPFSFTDMYSSVTHVNDTCELFGYLDISVIIKFSSHSSTCCNSFCLLIFRRLLNKPLGIS